MKKEKTIFFNLFSLSSLLLTDLPILFYIGFIATYFQRFLLLLPETVDWHFLLQSNSLCFTNVWFATELITEGKFALLINQTFVSTPYRRSTTVSLETNPLFQLLFTFTSTNIKLWWTNKDLLESAVGANIRSWWLLKYFQILHSQTPQQEHVLTNTLSKDSGK